MSYSASSSFRSLTWSLTGPGLVGKLPTFDEVGDSQSYKRTQSTHLKLSERSFMNHIALNLVSFSFFTSVEWFSRTALRSSRNSFLKIHSCEYAMTTTVRPFRFLFKPVQVRTDRKFYQTSHTIEAFEASQTSNNSRNATVRTVSVEILPD